MQGTMGSVDQPVWEPLFELVGEPLGGEWFMWMYEVELTGGLHVQAYKHRGSRRYLFLDDRANTYEYTRAGRYRSIEPEVAVVLAFRPWHRHREEAEETLAVLDLIERIELGDSVRSDAQEVP